MEESVFSINTNILQDLSLIDDMNINNKDIHASAFHQPSPSLSPIDNNNNSNTNHDAFKHQQTSPLQQPDQSSLLSPSFDSLPTIQKETYFGYSGRQRFFQCYRELSREYMTTGKTLTMNNITDIYLL